VLWCCGVVCCGVKVPYNRVSRSDVPDYFNHETLPFCISNDDLTISVQIGSDE
jgi:hypothetical protein